MKIVSIVAFWLFSLLVVSCVELPLSKPIVLEPLTDAIVIHAKGKKITYCGATGIRSLELILNRSGEWTATIGIFNNDISYRPLWRNDVHVVFYASDTPEGKGIATLTLLSESMKGGQKDTLKRDGSWNYEPVSFDVLKDSIAKVSHQCEGHFIEDKET
ncbi:MAG: hypothetical protein V3T17_19265 [Pseudomonadales bacterium]